MRGHAQKSAVWAGKSRSGPWQTRHGPWRKLCGWLCKRGRECCRQAVVRKPRMGRQRVVLGECTRFRCDCVKKGNAFSLIAVPGAGSWTLVRCHRMCAQAGAKSGWQARGRSRFGSSAQHCPRALAEGRLRGWQSCGGVGIARALTPVAAMRSLVLWCQDAPMACEGALTCERAGQAVAGGARLAGRGWRRGRRRGRHADCVVCWRGRCVADVFALRVMAWGSMASVSIGGAGTRAARHRLRG